MTYPPWHSVCAAALIDCGAVDKVPVLDAFSSVVDPCEDEPASLSWLTAHTPDNPVAASLIGEVDREQARMFERRYQAVCELEGTQAWHILRVALHRRMAGILASPGPRAARVRALVDFYFGQAAVLRWADPSLPEAPDLPVKWCTVAPGIEHGLLDGRSAWGPVHINLLRLRDTRIDTLDCRGHNFVDLIAERGAVAGVSGGFFLYSEPDIQPPSTRGDPVGLLVTDGTAVNPPWLRRTALVQTDDGRTQILTPVVEGRRWTRAHGRTSPVDAGPVAAVIGTRVVARGVGALEIPLAGAVVSLGRDSPLPPWQPEHGGVPIRSAMAGGPMLMEGGHIHLDLASEDFAGTAPPITFSQDETFDQNLLPRMAAGLTDDGALLFAAVDGRNFSRAPGLTLRQTALVLRAQGCVRAMNLDGGSSKRMVIEGRVVDLPSTEVQSGGESGPVRPVRSGILIGATRGV